MPKFSDRSTGEILILMIAGTVCFSILSSGFIIAVVTLIHPQTDVTGWISRVSGAINTLIGLLAGFLAGRTGVGSRKDQVD